MALKINHIAGLFAVAAAEKMIEADFIQGRRRGVGRDVPTDVGVQPVRFDYHRHGVPADIAFDATLDFPLAGISRLSFGRYGIDVRRVDRERDLESGIAQLIDQLLDEQGGLPRFLVPENIFKYLL